MSSSSAAAATAVPILRIKASRGWRALDLNEVWAYRELLYFFIWRDVKVRYKQASLGVAWAILQPVATMIVFTIFFGHMAKVGSDGLSYPLFSLAGILPWTLFSQGLGEASNSLVGSANLITKVYFPRVLIPAASVLAGIVDFAVAFAVLLVLLVFNGVAPGWHLLALPVFVLLAMAAALGIGLWFSAVNVEYRDVRYALPFLIQLWLFVTPVIYPASRVSAKLEQLGLPGWIYGLNPMAGVVAGFRWSLFGGKTDGLGPLLLVSVLVIAAVSISGAFYFRRLERTFADRV